MPRLALFGIPVRVRLGFVAFLALVVAWNPRVGWMFAVAVTAFSLLHEMGHAVAARRLGAEAEIALDFLAGTTTFLPPRPLRPVERARIALAGPTVEIAVGMVVLLAMGVHPFDVDRVFDSHWTAVVWIAGPVFGALNLLPVLPLDGGHVLAGGLDALWPGRGRSLALAASVVATVAFGAVAVTQERLRWLVPFAMFLVVLQALSWRQQRRAAQTPGEPATSAQSGSSSSG